MLRWLHDAFCVLKYRLSSPVTRCEPTNYCRLVKAKNRNSVLCARARASSSVSPPLLLVSAWVSNAEGAMGGKLPDKSKKCPRLEPFAPPFFGLNGVARASAGAARRLCRSVPPWGPPRAPPASRALARFWRCAVRGRTEQPMQEPQPRRPPVFLSVFAISRAAVPLFASSFFEERAERGTIS